MLYGMRKALFNRMSNDIGVMADHGDSAESLHNELNNADIDILTEYAKAFFTTQDKALMLIDFWYDTDPYTFRNNYEDIQDAFYQAKKCITDSKRTIEIIQQDIEELEDPDFTEYASAIIKILEG